ncbi:uncharacterized protein N7479_000421 [Penicillium vulpinum]|uniref:uncharacterized protein n=1 Tax=Penicillium vulpinum TaxID=29845 RepID=UPI002548DFD5|nr:uncharacterized protein N7479_000421 [Penicillium vulpinum]KAJ5970503.1 hypothetical protein N7479_000421 [Penicillium vulpinum]
MEDHTQHNGYYANFRDDHYSEKHTKGFFERLNYNWAVFPLTASLCFIALYQISVWTGLYDKFVEQGVLWTPDCTILAIIYGPFVLGQLPPYSTLWGLCLPMRPFAYKQSPKRRYFRELKVCLVTKGTNMQAALPNFVNVVSVPASFQPSHAKYKGRVLEWCRLYWKLSELDWVLHLDEETEIDGYLVKACFDFIERGTEDIGMGTIYYTSHNYWKNAFLTTAEIFRVADDFGRFQLPIRLFKRPLLGWMHGSFILINGAVENKVTWDTGCLAEDFWFAFHAARRGFKFGWVHAIAREQPPVSVYDLIQQRRRWYTGIMSMDSWMVKLVLAISMMGPLAYGSLNVYTFISGWEISVSHWFFVWNLCNIAVDAHGLIVGSMLQDLHLGDTSLGASVLHVILTLFWAPFVQFAHSVIFISAMIWPASKFVVIKKV